MQAMTVLGPVDAAELGVTDMHEHVMGDGSFSGDDPNKMYDEPEVMIEELRHFRAAGGRTMVELSTRGLKQDVRALRRISQESGVQIVTATGFYRECVYPEYVYQETADQLAERMIQDFEHGIDGTDIRPGIIGELATEWQAPGLSPGEEKVFRAGAMASVATGMAISTHCWEGSLAFEQIRAFTDEGVQPERIVIGHLGVRDGLMDHVLRIADTGVHLGIDTIGYGIEEGTDEVRADMVKALIGRGHLRRITLSQDMIRKTFLKVNGGHGYSHLLCSFVPMLKERGATDEEIDVMLVETPCRLLAVG